MSIREIGCCGAYCRTCRAYNPGFCRGCKIGYEEGLRDINRAKCKLKLCCFRDRNLETCAVCPDYPCILIDEHFPKTGWKYKQTRRQLEFIREYGYNRFLKIANKWQDCRGKLELAHSK